MSPVNVRKKPAKTATPRAGSATAVSGKKTYMLRLYVAGQTPKSLLAHSNLKKICQEHLQGRYRIEVVDLLKNPRLARTDDILAIPALVRKQPPPRRMVIGDLSHTERVLAALDLLSGNGKNP